MPDHVMYQSILNPRDVSVPLGLGLDVPYTGSGGSLQVAHASTNVNCTDDSGSSAKALQQMLKDLGYYAGPIDGVMDGDVRAAVNAFAAATGISSGDYFSKGAICTAIMDAWKAKAAPVTTPVTAAPISWRAALTPGIVTAVKSLAPVAPGPSVAPGTPAPNRPTDLAAKWGALSTGSKVAIVAGGVGVLGLVGWLLFGGKSKAEPKAPVTA